MWASALSTDEFAAISACGPLVNTLYAARSKAIARMSAQCQALGGHGVAGVSLTIGRFPGGGVEFTAFATAVRAPAGAGPCRMIVREKVDMESRSSNDSAVR